MPTIEAYVAHCFGEGERLVAGIGILVNNAVIFAPVPFATRDCAQWHRVFDVIVVGSFAYTPDDFKRALDLLIQGRVQPTADWLHERPLSEGPAAFAELVNGRAGTTKIVLRVP